VAYILLAVAVAVAVVILAASIRIAMEYERGVVFRLGRYNGVRGPGLYFLIPLIEISRSVSLRVETNEIDQQEMITRDSISLLLSAVIFYRIVDARASVIEVRDLVNAVDQFSLTTLRNVVGSCSLDEVLTNREAVTDRARKILDEVAEHWGVEIQRVEIKQIELPESMKRAMAREAEAIREKRSRVIKAEAELEASQNLIEAARGLSNYPAAIELRRLQTLAEIGAEHNSTILVTIPQDILSLARVVGEAMRHDPGVGGEMGGPIA
jgi:regulator of protease activity HflC (stomatin/prohibitin superfamily)